MAVSSPQPIVKKPRFGQRRPCQASQRKQKGSVQRMVHRQPASPRSSPVADQLAVLIIG